MQLIQFRVKDYRSYSDSGWVDVADLTTVIGSSGAGKTNLLTALWKLNPLTRAGRVRPESDAPAGNPQATENNVNFVEAVFTASDEVRAAVAELLPLAARADKIYAARNYAGELKVALDPAFPDEQVKALTPTLSKMLPTFAYYGNYGNLDSNIYLPSILRRFNRFGYNAVSKSLSRSLRIILSYIGVSSTRLLKEVRTLREDKTLKKLYPVDIKDAIEANQEYYAPLIKEGCQRLSAEFSKLWTQYPVSVQIQFTDTELKFFVSDQSGANIELQNHSVSMQWMLSFFLIYSVEISNIFTSTVLLFEDNGMAISPDLHKQLAGFLQTLSQSTKIILSTPNPGIVQAGGLNGVRTVYRNARNFSVVSNSLEQNPDNTNALSLQAVFSAFGLSVNEVKFTAFVPVLVPETADAYYLDIIKNYLSAGGWLYNSREIVFIPTDLSGMEKAAKLLAYEGKLPYVILPSTEEGLAAAKRLKTGLYQNLAYRVIKLSSIVGKNRNFEALVPTKWFKRAASHYISAVTSPDFVINSKTLVSDIEQFSKNYARTLPADFREQIAKHIKVYEVRRYPRIRISRCRFRRWRRLFKFIKKL